jgi:hypothetical protein
MHVGVKVDIRVGESRYTCGCEVRLLLERSAYLLGGMAQVADQLEPVFVHMHTVHGCLLNVVPLSLSLRFHPLSLSLRFHPLSLLLSLLALLGRMPALPPGSESRIADSTLSLRVRRERAWGTTLRG